MSAPQAAKVPDIPLIVYRLCTADEWKQSQAAGYYSGTMVDLRDGYIHLSTATQCEETLKKHFKGKDNVLRLSIDTGKLQAVGSVKMEPVASRGGAYFAHYYPPSNAKSLALPLEAVTGTMPVSAAT